MVKTAKKTKDESEVKKMRERLLETKNLHLGEPRVFEYLLSKTDDNFVTPRLILSEIAQELGMSRDLTMRLINRLTERRILEKYPITGFGRQYRIVPAEEWTNLNKLRKPLKRRTPKEATLFSFYLPEEVSEEVRRVARMDGESLTKTLTSLIVTGLRIKLSK